MMDNNISQVFLEGSRQLQIFHDQIMLRLSQLEEENRRLKEELRTKPVQPATQQTLPLPLVLEIFSEIQQEDCYSSILQNLSHKVAPGLLIQFIKAILICEYDDLDKMDSCYRSALQAFVEINQPECRVQCTP